MTVNRRTFNPMNLLTKLYHSIAACCPVELNFKKRSINVRNRILYRPTDVIIIFVIFTHALSSAAALPIGIHITKSTDTSDLIQKVVVIDDEDRKTEEEYAAAHNLPVEVVKERFAATGELYCRFNKNDMGFGQGNIILKNDIVATAAHVIFDNMDCKKRANLSTCRFRVYDKKGSKEYKIKEIVNSGLICPGGSYDVTKDWIVLRLQNTSNNIPHYNLDKSDGRNINENMDVVAVAKSSDFAPKQIAKSSSPLKYLKYPKHIGNCKLRDIYGGGSLWGTDCDVSHLASGGGLLINPAKPIIIGILRGGAGETEEQATKAAESGRPNKYSYNAQEKVNTVVPISGEFLKTLKSLSNEPIKADVVNVDRSKTSEISNKQTVLLTSDRFAATGEIICKNKNSSLGQAELIEWNDVIATPAHTLFRDLKCDRKIDLNQCSFKLQTSSGIQESKIEKIVEAGFQCPRATSSNEEWESEEVWSSLDARLDDWALLRLQKPIDGVSPYTIKSDIGKEVSLGQDVLAVAKAASSSSALTVEPCKVKGTFRLEDLRLIETNCSGAGKSSSSDGVALFENNSKPSLIGISTIKKRSMIPFVPITGDFLKAIDKIKKERPAAVNWVSPH